MADDGDETGSESDTGGDGDGDAVCGDGIVEGDEECDDANDVDTDACVSCAAAACGDGFVEEGVEECDDANDVDTDACVACAAAVCGDGFVHADEEECDDANEIDTDACIQCVSAVCGDGTMHEGVEQCEDGNTVDADGCEADCTLPACGNGVVDPGEFCHTDGVQVFDADVKPAGGPPVLAMADMDDDGNLDLLVVSIVENVPDGYVLLGDGTGTFEENGLFPLQEDPRWLHPVDVNADGFVDIVAATSDEVWVYVNDGTLDFMETQLPQNYGLIHTGAVGDFDGELGLDFAVMAVNGFTSYENLPFDPPYEVAGQSPLSGPDSAFRGAAVLDSDGDGDVDLAFTRPNGITLMTGAGDGTFASGGSLDGGGSRGDLVAMEATGDAILDLVATDLSLIHI